MAAVEIPPLAPEATARLLEACEALERHAARLTATGDPVGETIGLNAIMARCLHRLAVRPVAES